MSGRCMAFVIVLMLACLILCSCRQQASNNPTTQEDRVLDLLAKVESGSKLTNEEFEELVRMTQEPNVLVSSKAYNALWFVKEPEQKRRAAEVMRHALSHPDASIRGSACKGLGFVGTREDVELLLPKLHDPDPFVRHMALQAVGALGDSQYARQVRPLLNDPDAKVRRLAQETLQKWGVKVP